MVERPRLPKATPTQVAVKTTFTMQRLRRQALWGSAAAAALLIAVLASRTDAGSQRVAMMLASLSPASSPSLRSAQIGAQFTSQTAPRPLDVETATQQLAQTVRALSQDHDRMMTRIAAVEHNMDDMTGSITRQIETAKAATAQPVAPWPNDESPVPRIPDTVVSATPPVVLPPVGSASPLPAAPVTTAAGQSPPDAAGHASASAYGAEIGSASSLKTLHTRWAGIRSAHPQILEGLRPVVTLRENARSKQVELRLVVGPLATAAAAMQLCASLTSAQVSCQPTMFDARQPALE
jgi:hypothetical protein